MFVGDKNGIETCQFELLEHFDFQYLNISNNVWNVYHEMVQGGKIRSLVDVWSTKKSRSLRGMKMLKDNLGFSRVVVWFQLTRSPACVFPFPIALLCGCFPKDSFPTTPYQSRARG